MKQKFIFTIALVLVNTCSTLAYSCIGTAFIKGPVQTELLQSSAVFSGKLVSAEYKKGVRNDFIELEEQITGKKTDYQVLVLTFEVERYWKGDVDARVNLVAERVKDDAGKEIFSNNDYKFRVGEWYLVFAYGDEDRLGTNVCTRTTKLSEAKEDLECLGEGKEPKNTI